MATPEGYGIIPGRGRDNARAALAAAEAAGYPADVVRTVADGYLVPNAVLDKFEEGSFDQAESTEPESTPEPDGDETKTEADGADQSKADDAGQAAPAAEPAKDEDKSEDEAKPAKKPAAKSAAAKK
jgi:hypothetical protein